MFKANFFRTRTKLALLRRRLDRTSAGAGEDQNCGAGKDVNSDVESDEAKSGSRHS